VEPTHLGPIDRASLCLQTPANPIGVVAGVWRQTSFICWTQLSRLHLKTETIQMENVHNCDSYMHINVSDSLLGLTVLVN
jgi:hypothetical protein